MICGDKPKAALNAFFLFCFAPTSVSNKRVSFGEEEKRVVGTTGRVTTTRRGTLQDERAFSLAEARERLAAEQHLDGVIDENDDGEGEETESEDDSDREDRQNRARVRSIKKQKSKQERREKRRELKNSAGVLMSPNRLKYAEEHRKVHLPADELARLQSMEKAEAERRAKWDTAWNHNFGRLDLMNPIAASGKRSQLIEMKKDEAARRLKYDSAWDKREVKMLMGRPGASAEFDAYVVSRSISPPWGINPISSGSPRVRPMGRTCGEPDEIKKNTHPKYITALFRESRYLRAQLSREEQERTSYQREEREARKYVTVGRVSNMAKSFLSESPTNKKPKGRGSKKAYVMTWQRVKRAEEDRGARPDPFNSTPMAVNSISPGSALRTYDAPPWGCIVRAVSQTKSRKYPPEKYYRSLS